MEAPFEYKGYTAHVKPNWASYALNVTVYNPKEELAGEWVTVATIEELAEEDIPNFVDQDIQENL